MSQHASRPMLRYREEVRMETQTGLPHATGFGERFHRCLFYQKERSALGTLLYMRILRMIGIVG